MRMLAIAILALVSIAAAEPSTSAVHLIESMRKQGVLKDIVNMLVEKGTVCEFRGHKWLPGCGMSGCLAYHPGPTRHCLICGSVQTQEIGSWK